MKLLYTLMFIFFIGETTFSQTTDCKSVRLGKFESTSQSGIKTIIERTENTQFESIESMKLKSAYDLVWINDCTYELRNRRVLEGTSKFVMQPKDIIKVEITSVEAEKQMVKISSNFNEKIIEVAIYKIP